MYTMPRYFNPRPPRGGRRNSGAEIVLFKLFQSTPPARGATQLLAVVGDLVEFQSTPPARGATPAVSWDVKLTLLAISIHAPREGGDVYHNNITGADTEFQSTPPARGATVTINTDGITLNDFNPRPPRGGRL